MNTADFELPKNSNTITKEERDAFMDRLKRACRLKGTTVLQLQNMIGKTNAYFRNMGFISPKIKNEVLKYIPDLNIEYINKGIGEMFVTDSIPQNNDKDSEENEGGKKYNLVPLLPTTVEAGFLGGISETIMPYECDMIPSPVQGAYAAITVSGDSMTPEYPSGSIVFIKKINEKAFIEWGKVYVIDTCNGVILKKIYQDPDDEMQIICHSINPEYKDYTIDAADIYGIYAVLMQAIPK